MNNYLKTLDTDQFIEVRIKLKPITDNGAPIVKLSVNEHEFLNGPLLNEIEVIAHIPLLSTILIVVTLSNKEYAHKETAVVIEKLSIDDFNVLPMYSGQAFYINERNFTDPTSYLGFNGVWTLNINEPFYHWRHRITGQGWLLTL